MSEKKHGLYIILNSNNFFLRKKTNLRIEDSAKYCMEVIRANELSQLLRKPNFFYDFINLIDKKMKKNIFFVVKMF